MYLTKNKEITEKDFRKLLSLAKTNSIANEILGEIRKILST